MRKPVRDARILWIEDEPYQMSFLAAMLGEECASLSIACSVEEALNELSAHQYDLILLDIMLPMGEGREARNVGGMNAGVHLLQELRAGKFSGTAKDVPVVVITARADASIRRHMSELGISLVLEKPVMTSEVVEAIKELASEMPDES